ncbi:MarR family winged helix-turn-helix transcriptional regulator [Limosilactobacillus caccae]|uniref:MarR family winged helix-turn-helix transcriptional regulator n=1 Tax=Limosilactobacillus caccae TaxID=1926284 RepID=UPI000970FB15|nr:MarR family transcriptional regulator [Limosilactobacillus caccae]
MTQTDKKGELFHEQDSSLLLEHNLCFYLYVSSREFINRYTPLLAEIGLTYTQYVVMMVLWEEHTIVTRELRDKVFLDSGTLTPVLKKLVEKGFITKERSQADARDLIVTLTPKGADLRQDALAVRTALAKDFKGSTDNSRLLKLLREMVDTFRQERKEK